MVQEQTYPGKAMILSIGVVAIVLCFKYPDPARNLILLMSEYDGIKPGSAHDHICSLLTDHNCWSVCI